MQRIITVKLADVFPLEDEYGNQYASRDYSTKANQEYVRELAESMRAKGVPDEPIAVVEDGGIYRVKTGNSRVMAMRELGTRECPAIIDDDDDVQSVLEAVIRTDTKKKYEAVEKSRFVQQLMMFGGDEYVSEVAGIAPEKVKRMRKAREVVDDAGDDMTLDRLLLIDEFSDDPEAVKKLTDCKEAEAESIADGLRRKRKMAERRAAFEAAFGLHGVPCATDRSEVSGMTYFLSAREPAAVADALPPEWEDGQVIAFLMETWDGFRAEVYVSDELAGDDEDAAELRRQEEAYSEAFKAMDADRRAWFWANVAAGKPMPNLLREVERDFAEYWWVGDAVKAMPDDARAAAKNQGLSIYDYAIGFGSINHDGTAYARALAVGKVESYRMAKAAAYLDELMFYQADGWEPGDGHALISKLSEIVDGKEESEEDDD